MSPRKVRDITRAIQGRNAAEAVEILRYIPRKSARLVSKTLQSAIANAENNNNLSSFVLKNRFSGITGPCCDLKYDMDTGRLAEVTSSDF